jgi:S-adenosylmethionine-diacylgycerolhomoserine-N-methlytransferase
LEREDARAHMDGIYRYQRYIYDATRKYFLFGRDHLLAELDPPAGGSILEAGCGTGRNLILAAWRYPGVRCYGFDISSEMLKTARAAIAKARLSERVTVAEGDAAAFDPQRLFGRTAFDRVFISYALSMIPAWRPALAAAFGAVAPGGRLHVVDFGQQAGWPRWFKAALSAWLARFSVEPRADLEQELGRLAAASGARLRFERLYGDYAQYAVLERLPVS